MKRGAVDRQGGAGGGICKIERRLGGVAGAAVGVGDSGGMLWVGVVCEYIISRWGGYVRRYIVAG